MLTPTGKLISHLLPVGSPEIHKVVSKPFLPVRIDQSKILLMRPTRSGERALADDGWRCRCRNDGLRGCHRSWKSKGKDPFGIRVRVWRGESCGGHDDCVGGGGGGGGIFIAVRCDCGGGGGDSGAIVVRAPAVAG